MGALEYEVRPEYRDYTTEQLLDSPVTCFQGVGDIQRELLERYFQVATVKDLAEMDPFLQALHVQELVLEGGPLVTQSVADAARQQSLSFQIREADQARHVNELPDASVHVLEGLTPGQDLALYDAFRITNLGHLAGNRIMLEARVIEYLAEHGEGAEGPVATEAVASILGARAATAASGQARARSGEFDEASRAQDMARDVTEHVRDRVEAMRDRARDRAGTAAEVGPAAAAGGVSRMDAIRQSREQGGAAGRQAELGRERPGASGRAAEILASRGAGAAVQAGAGSVADRRRAEMSGLGGAPGAAADRTGGSRAESVLAARQLSGRGGPPQAATGGAPARPRTTTSTATATATRPAAAGAAAGAAAEAAGAGPTLPTEGEAAAAGAGAAGTAETRRRRANPAPLIAAAILVLIVLAGLIWFLVSRNRQPAQTTAMAPATQESQATTQGAAGTAPGAAGPAGAATTGAAGTQAGAPGGQAGTTSAAAGAPGTMATAQGPGTAKPPVAIKDVHTVQRGDTLWYISLKEYADPLNWPSIFMENKDQIKHPDVIFPKQKFRIPANPEYRFPEYPKGYQGKR